MRILWLSNASILNNGISQSGSWLVSMASALQKYNIELFNITEIAGVSRTKIRKETNIVEYVIPCFKLHNGLPSRRNALYIESLVNNIGPDIIHVWGTEKYWGLLKSRGYLKGYKCLLETQGILYSCCDYYRGGLYFIDYWRYLPICKAFYSLLFSFLQHIRFSRRLKYETEIWNAFEMISFQSEWSKNKILAVVSDVTLFKSRIPLRESFIKASKWRRPDRDSQIYITTITSFESYKALHVIIKALLILKRQYGNVVLNVIGRFDGGRIPRGYPLYLKYLIKKMDLENNVVFLGSLCASEMISVMQKSMCNVISSYVESYSVVLAESLILGVPTIVSFSGAMVELAENNVSALFYPPGDYVQCATRIAEIFDSEEMANSLSMNAITKGLELSNSVKAATNQLEIYENIYNL
jgi:Glycosyltransferase